MHYSQREPLPSSSLKNVGVILSIITTTLVSCEEASTDEEALSSTGYYHISLEDFMISIMTEKQG